MFESKNQISKIGTESFWFRFYMYFPTKFLDHMGYSPSILTDGRWCWNLSQSKDLLYYHELHFYVSYDSNLNFKASSTSVSAVLIVNKWVYHATCFKRFWSFKFQWNSIMIRGITLASHAEFSWILATHLNNSVGNVFEKNLNLYLLLKNLKHWTPYLKFRHHILL